MVDIMFEYWIMQQSMTGAFYNTATCAHCVQKFTAKERIERQESFIIIIIGGKQDKNLLYNLYYIIFF